MNEKIKINLDKILLTLSALTIAFIGITLFETLNVAPTEEHLIVLLSEGLVLASSILLLVFAVKKKVNAQAIMLCIIFFFVGLLIIDVYALFKTNTPLKVLPGLALRLTVVILYFLSLKNKKYSFLTILFLIILSAMAFMDVLAQNTLAFAMLSLQVAFILVLSSTKEEQITKENE